MKLEKKGFTLVEMLISISIFSIIMVSIMSVYLISTSLSYKSYVNRIIHENSKNVILTISEDIMKTGIDGVSSDVSYPNCNLPTNGYLKGDKFCAGDIEYYLAKKDENSGNIIRTQASFCSDFQKNHCYIVKNGEALTNNLVTVSSLNFFVTDEKLKKVTMSITMRPAPKSGVKPTLVKKMKFTNQITLSERKYNK